MSKQVKVIFSGDSTGAVNAIKKVDKSTKDLHVGFGDLSKMMYSTFGPALAGLGIVAVARQLTDAAIASQKMTNAMVASTGSAEAAASELAFVRAEANRLGLDLLTSAESYTKLTAAAQGTNLEGQATRDIFTAVSGAATSLGLRAEETSGALNAIQQMMSKGTVQAEELRGQLGERLPGSFNIAARAMGVTTAELGKMLEQGQVIADDFLPKFAKELEKTFTPTETMTKSAAAEINRFNTSLYDLKVAVMDGGGIDALNGLVSAGTAFVNITKDGIRLLAEEKLMLQQFATEIGIIMDGGAFGRNWLLPEGRAELKAELDAAEQMYQYSWNRIQERYGNAPGIMPQEFIGPPSPGKTIPPKTKAAGGIVKAAKEAAYDDPSAMLQDYADQQQYQLDVALQYQQLLFASWDEAKTRRAESLDIENTMEIDAITARVDAFVAGENAKREAAKYSLASTQQFLGDLSTLQNSHSRKAFELGKVASIANATISTYEGATAAYAAGAKFSPYVGAAFAAAALAAGMANVQKIASQQFNSGGGGMSVGGAGGYAGVAASPVITQPVSNRTGEGANTITVNIAGNLIGEDKWVEESLVPALRNLQGRNIVLAA